MSSQPPEGGEAARVPAGDELLGGGRFLRLVRRDGWEFVQRINSYGVVGIVATTAEGRLLLVEQWRAPVGRRCVELPAGLVGDQDSTEDHAQSAARELEEETGYRPASVEHLTDGVSSAGLSGEIVCLYRAAGLERTGEGGGTAGEKIQVHEVPLAQVPAFLREKIAQGCAIDVKVWAALWFVEHQAVGQDRVPGGAAP